MASVSKKPWAIKFSTRHWSSVYISFSVCMSIPSHYITGSTATNSAAEIRVKQTTRPLDRTGAIFTPLHVLTWSCVSCLCDSMRKAFGEVWDLINSSMPFLRYLWLRIWQWRWLISSGVTLQLRSTSLVS